MNEWSAVAVVVVIATLPPVLAWCGAIHPSRWFSRESRADVKSSSSHRDERSI